MIVNRRSLILSGASLAVPGGALAAEPPREIIAEQDFDELWRTLDERYCYFGQKATDWNKARRLYRPQAIAAQDEAAFTDVLSRMLFELYDPHTHVATSADGTQRYGPFDLWADWRGGKAVVFDVRQDSQASHAGVRPADEIISVDGAPIAAAVAAARPRCLTRPDPEAEAWSLRQAIAGRRAKDRKLEVVRGGKPRLLTLTAVSTPPEPPLFWKRLDGGLGYIRISTFSEESAVAEFDKALEALRTAPGLIIDARRNGGGDTAVARPMMGRFIKTRMRYAYMRRRAGTGLSAPWQEYVDPRGPFTYEAPVVVLTDRWSASMAEGFPMGMHGLGRARVVGTPMMQLGAAVFSCRLDRSGVDAQYSGEPVYDAQDHPRWLMRPDVEVTPSPSGEDVILPAGIAELKRMIAAA
ncbi:hypothetical protein BH11PSE2_BH11PSE2_14590 [soil metagenome]